MSLLLKILRAFTQFSIAFSLMRLAIILFSTNPLINLALAILSVSIFINTLGLVDSILGYGKSNKNNNPQNSSN